MNTKEAVVGEIRKKNPGIRTQNALWAIVRTFAFTLSQLRMKWRVGTEAHMIYFVFSLICSCYYVEGRLKGNKGVTKRGCYNKPSKQ